MAKTVLITGANKGVGLEFMTQYAAKGWHVIATHRRDEIPESLRALKAGHDNLRIEKVDVTGRKQITALAKTLMGVPIDLLSNNAGYAGAMFRPSQAFGSLDYGQFELIMRTNGLGALMLSEALADNVKGSKQKKIVALPSDIASFQSRRPTGRAYWYKMSKVSLHTAMFPMARDLKNSGVTVAVRHPGLVMPQKNLNRGIPAGLMVEGGTSVAALIKETEALQLEDSGSFIYYEGERLSL